MTFGEVADTIKSTYASQRLYINSYSNSPSTDDILKESPLLFVKNCLFWHFQELTGTPIDTLRTRFEEKMKTILIYGYESRSCEFKDLSESRQQKQVLNIIQTRFKETEVALLHSCSFATRYEDVNVDVLFPCIISRRLQGCRTSLETENEEDDERPIRLRSWLDITIPSNVPTGQYFATQYNMSSKK
ncbi:uncharacterized protein LOC122508329 [Leptopilina heterotoma]|uniref:uncharacterized protein LOC122508329 n=1 Tax=Leptopilina heterotoma TaxID=63436 RepID=UPI001CA86F54|nr:uncharacterized protein LOC122508329 [Leptopilina heterotoma]